MRLWRDTIRVEESTICISRLSLHRLPAERGCALCAVGISGTPGFGRDKRRTAQDSIRESDSFVCCVLRHAFVFRRQQRFEQHRCYDCVARRSDIVCAAESDLPRRQIALGCDRRVDSLVPDSSEEEELTTITRIAPVAQIRSPFEFSGPETAATVRPFTFISANSWVKSVEFDKIRVPRSKSRAMKFTQSRTFLRSLLILVCCCCAIAFESAATPGAPDSASWVQLSPANSPPARSYLAMTYDQVSRKIIMFGGDNGTTYLNDTWAFDGVTWTQVATDTPPPARAAAQMAYDSVTHKVVLFGGYNGRYLGDTWLWDGTTSQWTQAAPAHHPTPVTGPMLFPDPNGRVDLFGGFDGHFYQLAMWRWTGSDWRRLVPATVPYARSSAAVATNPTIDQVVMFGGLADVNPNNTWTYNGTTWSLRSPANQPLLVYAASAAFDPNINAVILFGGGSGGVDQNTTWQWFVAAGNWGQVATTQSPPPREGAGMAYSPGLGRVIVFGGQNSETPLNDTWQFIP